MSPDGSSRGFKFRCSLEPIVVKFAQPFDRFSEYRLPASEKALSKADCRIRALLLINAGGSIGRCY